MAISLTQDAHAHPNTAGAEVPVYVSTIMMDLHTLLPHTRPACQCRTRNDGFSICQEQRGLRGMLAATVFCHGGGDGETEILPRCHVQGNGITSEAWGDITVYQSFPGYLPPAFPRQGLWGQGRQRELLGWTGWRLGPRASAPDGALSYSLSLTASQLKHLKNVIMLHYPLPRAF